MVNQEALKEFEELIKDGYIAKNSKTESARAISTKLKGYEIISKFNLDIEDIKNLYSELNNKNSSKDNVKFLLRGLGVVKLNVGKTSQPISYLTMEDINYEKSNILNQLKKDYKEVLYNTMELNHIKNTDPIKYEELKDSKQITSHELASGIKYIKEFDKFLLSDVKEIQDTFLDIMSELKTSREDLEKIGFDFNNKNTPIETHMTKKDQDLRIRKNLENETFNGMVQLLTSNNKESLTENDLQNTTLRLFEDMFNSEVAEINGWIITALTEDFDNIKEIIVKSREEWEVSFANQSKRGLETDVLKNYIVADLLEYINKNTIQIDLSENATNNGFTNPFKINEITGEISYELSGKGMPDIIYNKEGSDSLSILNVSSDNRVEKGYNIVNHPFKMLIMQKLIENKSKESGKDFYEIFDGLKIGDDLAFSSKVKSSLGKDTNTIYNNILKLWSDSGNLSFLNNEKVNFEMMLNSTTMTVFNTQKNTLEEQAENYKDLRGVEQTNALILQFSQLEKETGILKEKLDLNNMSISNKDVFDALKDMVKNQHTSLLSKSGIYTKTNSLNISIEKEILKEISSESYIDFNSYSKTQAHTPGMISKDLAQHIINSIEIMSKFSPVEFVNNIYDIEKESGKAFEIKSMPISFSENLQRLISDAIGQSKDKLPPEIIKAVENSNSTRFIGEDISKLDTSKMDTSLSDDLGL